MALRREEALQATLRQALYLGDREVARQPLRHVATQLGVELDETDEDWTALAYEATKVLLDVSQERGRRRQGFYDQPTVFFRRAIATSGSTTASPATASVGADVAPASFASASAIPMPKQAQIDKEIKAAEARRAGSEEIDKIRMEGHEARISVTTYIKHERVMRAVGEMLMDMQLIAQNPFSICSWSNDEEKKLKSIEGKRKREAWDDRIYDLFGSPIYREPLEDVGNPLFWSPLIARHQGMRMEENLQLGPDDFGSDKGIPYLHIRHTIINGVKTLSSARKLPIHPQLIELGLLKLVALRRKQDHIRLFPFINRGKVKGTFSANFSKCFAYYRRTNDCYWPGLDFHALRTTFHHDLLRDDKSDAIRCRLMGHTYSDEGDRSYGQSLGIETLAERMRSVEVDISMIRNPFRAENHSACGRGRNLGLRVVG